MIGFPTQPTSGALASRGTSVSDEALIFVRSDVGHQRDRSVCRDDLMGVAWIPHLARPHVTPVKQVGPILSCQAPGDETDIGGG